MSTGAGVYRQHQLLAADYADTVRPPMKVTAYDPINQVVQEAGACTYPRADGQHSQRERHFYLDQNKIDDYDLNVAKNNSNRTQVVDNSKDNPFAAFHAGERRITMFTTELTGAGLPPLDNKTGDYSQIFQWKSIRASGGGSDPYLSIDEASDGIVCKYNSVQALGSKGQKLLWKVRGNFRGHQIKLMLDCHFGWDGAAGFAFRGELTGDPTKAFTTLVPWTVLPTMSPNSPASTPSWGMYQERWVVSIDRRYWDVEILA